MAVLDFVPLYAEETEDSIRARWEAWANEGLTDEAVEQFTDTREGSWFWIVTTPPRREFARFYDLGGREIPASSMPQFAWGPYLDAIGESRLLLRQQATPAVGFVTFTGTNGTVIPVGTTVGVEPATPEEESPSYYVTAPGTISGGSVELPVAAEVPGVDGNVSAGAVTVPLTPIAGLGSVLNDDPILSGTDEETDEDYSQRIIEAHAGAAAANQAYYRRIARTVDGVGRVTIIPIADGAGTLTVIVSTAQGAPVAGSVVTELQALLDPIAGEGAGAGQVGATITVVTTTTLDIDVSGTIEFEHGYGLDSSAGVIGLRDAILAAIAAYIDSVEPGQEVVRQHVIAQIVSIPGVHDVSSALHLNGGAANVAVDDDPAEIPTLGDTSGLVAGSV